MIFVEGHKRDNRKTYIFLLYCVLGVSQVIYAVHRRMYFGTMHISINDCCVHHLCYSYLHFLPSVEFIVCTKINLFQVYFCMAHTRQNG